MEIPEGIDNIDDWFVFRGRVHIPRHLDGIEGWFSFADRVLIGWTLGHQREKQIRGDLLELGCYLGKSAVLIGGYRRPGETFTVLDLFEGAAGDEANQSEQDRSYETLTRAEFEQNYLRYHSELPTVIQGLSSMVTEHVKPDSCRFIHIDASHLYDHVRGDAQTAKSLLRRDGIVVFDDYRSEHTPGVACAVWEAVVNDGLIPLFVTPTRLFGTWGDPRDISKQLWQWAAGEQMVWAEYQQIAGHQVIRIRVKTPNLAAAGQAGASTAVDNTVRRIAKELLPPVVSRRVHRLRKRLPRR